MKWTNTVEAVAKAERAGTKAQWDIGDALIDDLEEYRKTDGTSDHRKGRRLSQSKGKQAPAKFSVPPGAFQDCSEQLAKRGYKRSPVTLTHLLRVADNFPRAERDFDIAWEVHNYAGNPLALKRLLALLRKAGKPITAVNAGLVMTEWRRRDREERGKKIAAAKKARDAARLTAQEGREEKIATKDKTARAKADAKIKKAEADKRQAEHEHRTAVGAPIGSPDAAPAPEASTIEALATLLVAKKNATTALKKAQKELADLRACQDYISPETRETLMPIYGALLEAYGQIIELLSGRKAISKTHLRSIEGGAA